MKFEALDKELQDLLYRPDTSKLISVLKEGKKPLFLEQISLLDLESCKHLGFPVLWSLYEDDFIPFEEDFLIEKFADALYLLNKHKEIESFILKRPRIAKEIGEKLSSYFLEKRDISVTEYEKLLDFGAKGFFKGTQVVPNFLESLLSPMKTYTANTYCGIIESCKPTAEELLPSQHTLFALLSSDKTSVINFVIKLIKQIADEKAFDFQSFADNFALCFATPKIAKSQLIGLGILENHYKKQVPSSPDYREQLAVLFTIPDAKLQEKVASLLTTYFGGEGLAEVVAPYQDYLKGKAQELLQSLPSPNSSETSETACVAHTPETACVAHTPETVGEAHTPRTWDDLLFLIGDCIRERSPLVLDLFFEGLNQLQAQIPKNFSQQISPYQKQLGEQPFEFTTYRKCMRWVIDVWEGKASLSDDIFCGKLYNPTPFLREKTKRLLLKLKQGNSLPFVSTPTHAPFYIDPLTFLERIAQYEKAEKSPMLEDVVVGLNRLLPTEVTEEQKQLARSLTGNYAPALQYYFEVNKQIAVTDATRVLWGQVLRLKDIDGVFPELEIPQKTNLQGLVRPFYLKYEVKPTKINGVERNKIILEDNWDKKYSAYSLYNDLGANYYNVSPMSRATDEDIDYGLSLNPRYIDGWLCKYLLTYAQGVEGESLTEATHVMSLLLEHHLPIYHGGWLMVATCLLAERKPLRDLATEYILLALQRGETLTYLAEAIGTFLAHKYAPIARFVEFLDIPTRDPKVKGFQKAVVQAYLPLAEKQEKKPTNHKKLAQLVN